MFYTFQNCFSITTLEHLATQSDNQKEQFVWTVVSKIVSAYKSLHNSIYSLAIKLPTFQLVQSHKRLWITEPNLLAHFSAVFSEDEVGELQDILQSLLIEDHIRIALFVPKTTWLISSYRARSQRGKASTTLCLKEGAGMESDGKNKMV